MGRLSAKDLGLVSELVDEVRTVRLEQPSVWQMFLPQLKHALQANLPFAYGVRLTEAGPQVSFLEGSPRPTTERARALFAQGFRATPRSHTPFPPVTVEVDRRNPVKRGELGIANHDHLRVLVCEDESLLAWVGAFRDAPFTQRERLILRAVTPALRERLTLERRLETHEVTHAALDASLEALAKAAMIVDHHGHPHLANSLAKNLLASDAQGLRESVVASLRGHVNDFTITKLRLTGARTYFLVVQTFTRKEPAALVPAAMKRWQLTPREGQTLALVAEGLSNRAISAKLACAERTVEVHVGRLLAKSGTSARAQLVAQFWQADDAS